MKYLLEIDEDHAKVIIKALDVFSRIHMGQLGIVTEQLSFSPLFDNVGRNDFDELIRKCKAVIRLGCGEHLGIRSPRVGEDAKVAYDIQQIIRYRLAWDRQPEGGHDVDFQGLFKCSKSETLPKIYGEKHEDQRDRSPL